MKFEFKENLIGEDGRCISTKIVDTYKYSNVQEAVQDLQEQFYTNPKVAHFEIRKLVNGHVIITNYMKGGIVLTQLKSVL